MRKDLTYISEEEKCTGILLFSLQQTFYTLLKMNGYDLDKKSILDDLIECENNIQKYWSNIADKYHIPLYIDRPMMIDNETNMIYVIIQDEKR